MRTDESMAVAYRCLLKEVYFHGHDEVNARTGVGIRALPGGYSFKLHIDGDVPVAGNRRYWPRIAAAEVAWQIMGTQDPQWILAKAHKMWSNFVEDGKLKTAYGYRWRKHFGRDQLQMAIDELNTNPTNRQLYVSAWDPASDGLGGPNQPKNIPCPVGFSVSRLADKLHMSVFIRSSDVFVGLPYDVMSYALTLDAMVQSVPGTWPGTLHVTLAHPHLYHPHLELAQECLRNTRWTDHCQPRMPSWSVSEIEEDPDGYIAAVAKFSGQVNNNEWSPLPELVV